MMPVRVPRFLIVGVIGRSYRPSEIITNADTESKDTLIPENFRAKFFCVFGKNVDITGFCKKRKSVPEKQFNSESGV